MEFHLEDISSYTNYNDEKNFLDELDLVANSISNSLSLRKIFFDEKKICEIKLALTTTKTLKKIRLFHCYLDDEKISKIFLSFKKLEKLINIDLTNNNLISNSVKVLKENLPKKSKVRSLSLMKNKLNNEGLNNLSSILKKCKSLLELNISYNNFTPDCLINSFAAAIGKSKSLQVLNLSYNKISENSICEICNEIIINKAENNLTDLLLKNCGINDIACKYLGKMFKFNVKIKEINLNENKISSKGIYYISKGIKNNDNLKLIKFEYNEYIGDLGIFYYTNALKINTSIESLFLNNLIYGEKALFFISQCLEYHNNKILYLNLSNNKISKKGIETLCESLKFNRKIKSITFDYCDLNNFGLTLLFKSLKENINTNLYSLSLEGNNIGYEAVLVLGTLLKENKTIKNLKLKSCGINNISAKIIFKNINEESEIYVLDVSNNLIDNSTCEEIGKAIQKENKLNYLYLNSNEITDEGVILIAEFLKKSKNFEFEVIDISDMNISRNVCDILDDLLKLRKDKNENLNANEKLSENKIEYFGENKQLMVKFLK